MIFLWPRKTVSVSVRYLFYQRSKHGLFVFPNLCGEGTVRLANRISVWRQSEVSIDFRKVLLGMKFFNPSIPLTNQKPRAFVSFRRTNQIALFRCFLFLFCSRVFISRSDENRSQKTVNVYTADVTDLKGRRHAICYLFEREKQSPRINWFPKVMVQFCFTFLDYMTYLGMEYFSCYFYKGLARRSTRFQVLMLSIKNCYGQSAPWWNLFDIFFITLQEHFCVWLQALSNELVSKDLT